MGSKEACTSTSHKGIAPPQQIYKVYRRLVRNNRIACYLSGRQICTTVKNQCTILCIKSAPPCEFDAILLQRGPTLHLKSRFWILTNMNIQSLEAKRNTCKHSTTFLAHIQWMSRALRIHNALKPIHQLFRQQQQDP